MPLTRGKALGYDADLMAFKFTMRNGQQIVQCQISIAALSKLADRRRGSAGDFLAEFKANRELIEDIGVRTVRPIIQCGNQLGQHIFETHSRAAVSADVIL